MPANLKITRRTAAAALALSIVLPAVTSVQAGNTPQGIGGMSIGKPDLIATVGFIDGKRWTDGGTLVLNNPGFVQATQVGPQSNMCRFIQMDLQPKNAGPAEHGAFVTKVYRDNALVHTEYFAPTVIPPMSPTNFRKWTIDLKEGINTVRVEIDANKQVAEMKESNNNYIVRFDVQLDCDGDGRAGPNATFDPSPNKGGKVIQFDMQRPKPGSRPNSKPGSKPRG